MHFGLDVRSAMKKQEIKTKVANKLLEEIFFETRDFQEFFKLELEPYKISEMQHQIELEKIQLEREKLKREFQLEKLKLDGQEREKEREERAKEHEENFELRNSIYSTR